MFTLILGPWRLRRDAIGWTLCRRSSGYWRTVAELVR